MAPREEIERYLSLDYLYLWDMENEIWVSNIQLYFPAGTISEDMIGVDVDYSDFDELLQLWVLPKER